MSAGPGAGGGGEVAPLAPTSRSRAVLPLAAVAAAAGLAAGAVAVFGEDVLTLPTHWSAPLTAAALIGVAVLALVMKYPGVGVVALLAVSWSNLSEILVRTHQLPSVLQLFVPSLIVVLALRRAAAPATVIDTRSLAFTILALVYLAVVLASTCWALDVELADGVVVDQAKAIALALVVAHVIDGPSSLRRAVWTLVLTGSLLAVLSSYQVLAGDWSQTFGGLARVKQAHISGSIFKPRATGPLADPNFYAQSLLVLVPLALSQALTHPRRGLRALAWACAGAASLGVLTTYSRGGAIALGLAIAMVAFLERRRLRARHALVAVVVGACFLVLAPRYIVSRLETLSVLLPGQEEGLQRQDSSVNKRRVLMGSALAMAVDHPLLGVGAGNFSTHFDEYSDRVGADERIYQEPGDRAFPHSLPLELAAETGLVGLAAFFAAALHAAAAAMGAGRRWQDAGDASAALLARAIAIAIVAYLASSLILHGDYIRYLWTLLGLGVAAARSAPPTAGEGR